MKRCVIVGGADINNYEYIKSCLRNDDFIVFCDSGLKHLESLQVNPGLIVGDFDSHDNPHLGVETIVLPCEKDDTDTVFAVKEAIKRGFDDFVSSCFLSQIRRGCRKSKDFRQPLVLNELLNIKLATKRSKPEGGVFHPLFA